MYDLVFLTGTRAGAVIPADGTIVAGREPDCEVNVPDPQVSRSHAIFEWDGQRFRLTDTRSSNGTYVNERPIREVELQHGDIVRMGGTRLRVVRRDAARTSSGTAVGARAGAMAMHGGAPAARSSLFGLVEDDGADSQWTHSVPLDRAHAARSGTVSEDEIARLRDRLASMVRVAGELAQARTPEALFEAALDALFELLPQTGRGFLLLGKTAAELEPAAMRDRSRGTASAAPTRDELQVSRSICRAALDRREGVLYREGSQQPFDAGQSIADLHIRSALAVPMSVGDDVLGVVVLDTRELRRAYREEDLELAVSICQQIAVAVRNLELVRQVEEQTRTRDNLMRFLPKPMADQVLEGRVDAGLGGRKHRGTVMFADLVGFTARSERVSPTDLVGSMNAYFERVAPCILAEEGSIDKFMGDAIMAVWGIPVAIEDASPRAVAAALRMQARLLGFNAGLDDPFHVGIGIHSGELVAGNIGVEERREYTVLGDVVNTAQRVETIACIEQVLVTRAVLDDCDGRCHGIRLPDAWLKNKAHPVATFSIRGLQHADAEEVQLFVPVRVGGGVDATRGWLIRRLTDRGFVGVFERGDALHDDVELVTDAVEWRGVELGAVRAVAAMPSEREDGGLSRVRFELPDASLAGLLGGEVVEPVYEDLASLERSASAVR